MKTKQTFWRNLLILGLSAVLAGVALFSFGLAAGGIDGIMSITKPDKKTLTFDQVTDLNVVGSGFTRIETGDVDKVTVTYYTGSKFLNKVDIHQDDKTLAVWQEEPSSIISGFMESAGFLLNSRGGDYETIVITLPQGMPINTISDKQNNAFINIGSSEANMTLNNLQVKKIDFVGALTLNNTTISEGGNLTLSGFSHFDNSKLAGLTIDVSDHLSLQQSNLENITFPNFTTSLEANKSSLKNISFSNAADVDADILESLDSKEDEDYDYYDEGDAYSYEDAYYDYTSAWVRLSDSTIENTSYSGVGRLELTNTNFIGNVSITGPLATVSLKMNDNNKKSSNIALTTTDGQLTISDKLAKELAVKKETKEATQFTRDVSNATSKFSVTTDHGSVSLK